MDPQTVDDATLDIMPDVELLAILITEMAAPGTYTEAAIEMSLDEMRQRITERLHTKRDLTHDYLLWQKCSDPDCAWCTDTGE